MPELRLLFDVLHPAHVHHYRPLAQEVLAEGGEVLFTARKKDVTLQLLAEAGLPHKVLSTMLPGGLVGLASEFAYRSARLAAEARRFRPDAMLGIMGPCIAPVGRLMRIPTVVSYDTETAGITNRWVFPLATRVLVPESWRAGLRPNMHRFAGFQELAYLHPRRFAADRERLVALGVAEPYIVVRFVSFEASHDLGDRGFSDRVAFVRALERHARVVISSERGVPEELRDRVLRFPASDLHHLLAFADLVVGEGATTCVEAALLGTPAIFVHTAQLGYIRELEERWQLLAQTDRQDRALELAEAWFAEGRASLKATWSERRAALLEAKCDTTGLLRRTVEELLGIDP
jgi:predicted glycosyltransferase